jgi:hypothetical protein
MLQRIVELNFEPGMLPEANISDFIKLSRVAFGNDHETFSIQLTIKNTGTRPILLDLNDRYFTLDDDLGRTAALVYFCCDAKGESLAPGGERKVQLFFRSAQWYGKKIAAHSIFFRVHGFLPIVRASWKLHVLATAE